MLLPVTPDTLNSMLAAAQAAQNSLNVSTSSQLVKLESPRSPQRKATAVSAIPATVAAFSQSASEQIPIIVQAVPSESSPENAAELSEYGDDAPKSKRQRTDDTEEDDA